MHPHTFYSTLFGHEKRDEVFVVMSFAPEFDARWDNVIRPTIESDLKLKANRVDYNLSGESVVHDILNGIAHARLIVADITSAPMKDSAGNTWPQRNGNVMWEVGIAHTMRMPDEVVLVRSDSEPTIFDLTQFRAFSYDPSEVKDAKLVLKSLCEDRLKTVDQTKADYVKRCADALDPHSAHFLLLQVPTKEEFSIQVNMGNALIVPRLFELGLLKPSNFKFIKGPNAGKVALENKCVITSLGLAVTKLLGMRMGLSQAALARLS